MSRSQPEQEPQTAVPTAPAATDIPAILETLWYTDISEDEDTQTKTKEDILTKELSAKLFITGSKVRVSLEFDKDSCSIMQTNDTMLC